MIPGDQPTGGRYLELADKAQSLIDGLAGTPLAHWEDSLRFLVADCQREAGARAVHELRDWAGDPSRAAA